LYGAEIWILWKVDQKYVVSFEMWCWRRMEKFSWTDRLKNEEVLKGGIERTTYNEKKGGQQDWSLLGKNCLPKHVVEGKIRGRIELTGRQGRRRMQLLDNFKEKRIYCKFKDEALVHPVQRIRFGPVYGPVVRQTT